jgi:hypothetical protein
MMINLHHPKLGIPIPQRQKPELHSLPVREGEVNVAKVGECGEGFSIELGDEKTAVEGGPVEDSGFGGIDAADGHVVDACEVIR